MLNMSGNHAIGNRNSTPEANTASTLRPPSSRVIGSGHSLRASADMAALSGPSPSSRIRPSSDFYGQSQQALGPGNPEDSQDKIAQQWIADIDQYETTLEEMAAATLDQDFKDELSAIEQWFRVLSEAERTAALYALLQQTTQVQIRFFIQVLQQMGKNHPMSGVLSPASFDKDPMSNRLSDAMSKLNVDAAPRNSMSRNSVIASKRHSGLDPSTINAMFPDAAAAIATEKAKFTQQTGNPLSSNRNSLAVDPRSSLAAPGLPGPQDSRDVGNAVPSSPWGSGPGDLSLPKAQAPMGQFVQPAPATGGLRSPRPQLANNSAIQNTTLTAPDNNPVDLPLLSPYNAGSGNWASMVNTPMASTFNAAQTGGTQADMVANATAMKLAALSTVNNRFALDDVRKYRRARSNDAPGNMQNPMSPGAQGVNIPGANVVMINEHGQVLSREQLIAIQAYQSPGLGGQRSRPNSPGLAMQSGLGQMGSFTSPQNNGFLSAYDGTSPLMNGLPSVNLGQLGMGGHEGYLSDHSDMVRGRSPRGRRGSSKPPEDPTDPTLLQDIPSWLRSLRLHKYTDNLKDMKWTDLVELDDKALEDRGVNALGARRKMLKVFEQVKEAKAEGKNPDDASDADSDLEELESDIAKYDESVRQFLASQRDEGGSSRPGRGPRSKGLRGPRKAAKPRGDITARLSKVNQAFLSGDYERALDLAFEVIRINAETHPAWTTLASIFREQGDSSKALSAMVYAAHLRPKDVGAWLRCAAFALENVEENEAGNLHTARLCYSAALRANPNNLDARLGKALVCHRQGQLSAAISEYKFVLNRRPYDLEIVRKLAEACVDNKHAETAVPAAIIAYERYFSHEKISVAQNLSTAPWFDVGIYVELFASTGRYLEAIRELKELSRWFLGRGTEEYWEVWQDDDREWDADNERRTEVAEFDAETADIGLYGQGLPHDLRARLAIYRLRLGNDIEATRHLWWLDPLAEETREFSVDFPFIAFDLAGELSRSGQTPLAIKYYEILRDMPGNADATILLQLGRCYSVSGEHATAEEYFLAAIDADEDNIEARIELANLYEKAREEEEALILAAEALALREARDQDGGSNQDIRAALTAQASKLPEHRALRHKEVAARRQNGARGVIPRRYRPKRLAGADKRQQDEQARAVKLSQQYQVVRDLREQINAGRTDLVPTWMASSKELVDDFRSLKKFYTWEKYLHFLGSKSSLEQTETDKPKTELAQMYERLARTLAPNPGQEGGDQGTSDSHQGISFDKWLDLFLDYAIGLAIEHRREEAYQVCEAARDSTAFQTSEHGFMIYVAWGVCAIYSSDEEKCVATARQLMRDGAMSDSYRMFALLSCLCQSPVSWYTSGPAQKYILRQIKAMDDAGEANGSVDDQPGPESSTEDKNLDACLLMLYGHILFTSTSYTFALGYFLRARALDADNLMVNLSLGLSYVHYGLKRQSTNRQYLLLQGQCFLTRYAELSQTQHDPARPSSAAEAYYNIGRLYQLLGLNYLAHEYYFKATEAAKVDGGDGNINSIILNNELISLLNIRNNNGALALLREKIRI
ncbi:hypothetical protein G7046_g2248 [Stylonectria norvegica]|nr:hypothetical protein G7046_g2248 [Stylonectria norvegica]